MSPHVNRLDQFHLKNDCDSDSGFPRERPTPFSLLLLLHTRASRTLASQPSKTRPLDRVHFWRAARPRLEGSAAVVNEPGLDRCGSINKLFRPTKVPARRGRVAVLEQTKVRPTSLPPRDDAGGWSTAT